MPLITDKFGKASVNSDVAIATTVKTTRSAGISVLEAIDLSKYAPDTPVFVVTYKKTTDPLTGVATITQLRSWKALVNTGANTLTNLTIQPGYADDIGNAVGDFIECIPTSAWENSLIDGILTSLNPDGTLKTSAVQTALGLGGGSLNGWNVLGYTPSTIVDNGNGSFTATILGVDKTDTISPSTKILGIRSVAAPTYMGGLFNGTNKYFTKVTPSGTLGTFTDNFTLMGFAYPTSIPSTQTIAARVDAAAANGVWLRQEVDGRISCGVLNAGAGNYRFFQTSQSIPVNRKTHIAATWAAGVCVIYVDGLSVPLSTVVTAGTAPTTAGTGGDFSIGRYGAYTTSSYWNGYISGVGVFNAVLSAATIRSYKNQVLSGAEANCIGAWSLNNTLVNQQNPGTNDMTAQGGVGFTSGMSPYATNGFRVSAGSNEFGLVMASTFTGGNTVLVIQCPEGCALPTVGSLSSLQYSSAKSPYGFPAAKNRWRIEYSQVARSSVSASVAGNWYNAGDKLTVPIGDWILGYSGTFQCTYPASTNGGLYNTLSTANNSASDIMFLRKSCFNQVSNSEIDGSLTVENPVSLAAATDYFLNARSQVATSVAYFGDTISPAIIYATPAGL